MAPITVNYLIIEIRIWSGTELAMINAKSTKSCCFFLFLLGIMHEYTRKRNPTF